MHNQGAVYTHNITLQPSYREQRKELQSILLDLFIKLENTPNTKRLEVFEGYTNSLSDFFGRVSSENLILLSAELNSFLVRAGLATMDDALKFSAALNSSDAGAGANDALSRFIEEMKNDLSELLGTPLGSRADSHQRIVSPEPLFKKIAKIILRTFFYVTCFLGSYNGLTGGMDIPSLFAAGASSEESPSVAQYFFGMAFFLVIFIAFIMSKIPKWPKDRLGMLRLIPRFLLSIFCALPGALFATKSAKEKLEWVVQTNISAENLNVASWTIGIANVVANAPLGLDQFTSLLAGLQLWWQDNSLLPERIKKLNENIDSGWGRFENALKETTSTGVGILCPVLAMTAVTAYLLSPLDTFKESWGWNEAGAIAASASINVGMLVYMAAGVYWSKVPIWFMMLRDRGLMETARLLLGVDAPAEVRIQKAITVTFASVAALGFGSFTHTALSDLLVEEGTISQENSMLMWLMIAFSMIAAFITYSGPANRFAVAATTWVCNRLPQRWGEERDRLLITGPLSLPGTGISNDSAGRQEGQSPLLNQHRGGYGTDASNV